MLWKIIVDALIGAAPAVYTCKGKTYIVCAAGGNFIFAPRLSRQLFASALFDESTYLKRSHDVST